MIPHIHLAHRGSLAALGLGIVLGTGVGALLFPRANSPAPPAIREDLSPPVVPTSGANSPGLDADGPAAPFLRENDAAMAKMMETMSVKPTGDVDRDFVAMMVPHHQGAIDMARAELRYGTNERLRRLAQEIIVTQQDEIAVMRLAVGDPLPPSAAAPTTRTNSAAAQPPQGHEHRHMGHEGR
jgi:Domain of unknown function (DUF305)